jgi:MFS family permease
VYPLGQFIGSPILGALSDDYGRKPLLSGSLSLAAIGYLLTGIAIAWGHLGLLIVSRLIAGFMEGNIAIARAMTADLKLLSKHETFGKINAVSSIAYLVGPLLGGLMTDKSLVVWLTTSTPFFFICILFCLLAGLSALVLKKSVITPPSAVQTWWQRMNFIKRIRRLFANKQLKFLMITSTYFTLAVDIFYEFGPVYLTVKWGLFPAQLIFYNGVLCLGLAVGNGWLPTFISSRVSHLVSILSAIGGFAFLLIGITCIDSPFFMVLFFALSGLCIGLAVTLLTVKISDSVSDRVQGEVMGTQLSLRVLGDAVICLLGGALLILSSKLILILAAVISLGSMIYYRIRHMRSS